MKITSVDPLGEAIHDYFTTGIDNPLTIHSRDFEDDHIKPSYFFRNYKNLPALEKKALKMCRGKILDVGACAGSHSLWLQQNGMDVTALEISEKCCQVILQRGIKKIVQSDIFKYNNTKQFDTIILLMNGTGIAETLPRLSDLFVHLKKLLREGGQIIIDSSDLIYLYEGEPESAILNVNTPYYGEIKYQYEYKGYNGNPFSWLYVDAKSMQEIVSNCGLKIKQIINGKHYDYLAQIEN